jgi:hypothetical protein
MNWVLEDGFAEDRGRGWSWFDGEAGGRIKRGEGAVYRGARPGYAIGDEDGHKRRDETRMRAWPDVVVTCPSAD